jgi:beta-lactamase regulating signal transducer with metallopeptidase domain
MKAVMLALGSQSLLLLGLLLALALLRPLMRRGFGAVAAYQCWAIVPVALLAAQLPAGAIGPTVVLAPLLTWVPASAQTVASAWPLPTDGLGWRTLCLVWLSGVAFTVMCMLRAHQRYVRGLVPATDDDDGPARWRSVNGSSPAQRGWWRGGLVLPADFEQRFTPAEQQLVLLHEQVHVNHRDNLWNLLTALLCAMHWFNPLVWWGARRMRLDQELACDAAVLLHHPRQAATYAQALLKSQGMTPAFSLASQWLSLHPLVERVAMLKHHTVSDTRRRCGRLLAGVCAALSLVAVYSTHAAPSAAIDKRVELRVDMQIDQRAYGPVRLITKLGVPATVEVGDEGGARWRVLMTTTQLANGQLQTVSTFSTGRPLVELADTHTMTGPEGQPIDLLRSDSSTPSVLKLSRVVRLIDAAQKP